ncbi:hypothetical protein FB446DRAFT_708404 [Lentinula raphanica]|nr:hypothetical protein FB446DRAFT_708404 [Lentinula raphanica]
MSLSFTYDERMVKNMLSMAGATMMTRPDINHKPLFEEEPGSFNSEPGLKECGLNRYHVNWFPPYAVTSLKYAYTFYSESPSTPTASNFLMQSKMRWFGYLPLPQLHGNVLVMKHNQQGVVAMETKDWPLVKVILEWLIDNRVHYADVKPPLFQTPKLLVRPVRWVEAQDVTDSASN